MEERWVAVVYSDGDKVASRVFSGFSEAEIRHDAQLWVNDNFGEDTDWSLHHIHDR